MLSTFQEARFEQPLRRQPEMMLNLNHPSEAYHLAALPVGGVGLFPLEALILQDIQVHPLALIHFDMLSDRATQAQIEHLTPHYTDKQQFFVDRLAQGIGTIAAAFYPRPVLVQFSNLRSDAAQQLAGGSWFEPIEENPAIGWRGAVRYTDDLYRAAFALECQAFRRVRDGIGLTNLIPVIPFCRTLTEAKQVLAEMAQQGLEQGKNQLQVYLSVDLPSTVMLADAFCQLFDGLVINTSNLSQLVLGLDQTANVPATLREDSQTALQQLIRILVSRAQEYDRPIGLSYPHPTIPSDFLQFILSQGVHFLSLHPNLTEQLQTMVHPGLSAC